MNIYGNVVTLNAIDEPYFTIKEIMLRCEKTHADFLKEKNIRNIVSTLLQKLTTGMNG